MTKKRGRTLTKLMEADTIFEKEGNGVAEVGKGPLDPSAPFYEQEVCLLGKTHHSVEAKVVPIFSVIYVFTHTNLCPVPHSTDHLHRISYEWIFCEGERQPAFVLQEQRG